MLLLDETTALDYLRDRGAVAPGEPACARELAGGVSNVVLLIERPAAAGGSFVLKQAREQLRVALPWFCSPERIRREVEVLRIAETLLAADAAPAATLPRVLWEDEANFAFAMTAAPPGHATWKSRLLAGETDERLAAACGELLGRLHARSWQRAEIAARLDDRQFFDALRLDPYYRQVARAHPDLAAPIAALVASVWQHRLTLVHGDFSPKNLLVYDGGLMLIDCEVGHFGDPAFDLGFFLTHLALKQRHFPATWPRYARLAEAFWQAYQRELRPAIGDAAWQALAARARLNLAGCLLARIDGKSPAEYLSEAERDQLRPLARGLLLDPPPSWAELAERLRP